MNLSRTNNWDSGYTYAGPIIYFEVGPDPVVFCIHQGLLRNQSGYFNSCLQDFPAGDLQVRIVMESEQPSIFQHFLVWMYTGNPLDDGADFYFELHEITYGRLLKLYFFALSTATPKLENLCIDVVISKARETKVIPSLQDIALIWVHLHESSPMRSLLVDMVAQLGQCSDFANENDPDACSADFLVATIRAQEKADRSKPFLSRVSRMWEERCHYYTPTDDVEETE